MPLFRHPKQPEEQVCSGCRFYPTKPDNVPDGLADHVETAAELSELSESGAHFSYPDSLTPLEWACATGLTRGIARAKTLQDDRVRKKRRTEEAKNRFKNG